MSTNTTTTKESPKKLHPRRVDILAAPNYETSTLACAPIITTAPDGTQQLQLSNGVRVSPEVYPVRRVERLYSHDLVFIDTEKQVFIMGAEDYDRQLPRRTEQERLQEELSARIDSMDAKRLARKRKEERWDHYVRQAQAAREADKRFTTWQDYGTQFFFDAYRAFSSIHQSERLMQVFHYGSSPSFAIEALEPVTISIVDELTSNPNREARLMGYALFVDLLVRHPQLAQMMIKELHEEIVSAVEAGKPRD